MTHSMVGNPPNVPPYGEASSPYTEKLIQSFDHHKQTKYPSSTASNCPMSSPPATQTSAAHGPSAAPAKSSRTFHRPLQPQQSHPPKIHPPSHQNQKKNTAIQQIATTPPPTDPSSTFHLTHPCPPTSAPAAAHNSPPPAPRSSAVR